MAVDKKPADGRRLAPLIRQFFLATQFGAQLIVSTLIFLLVAGFFAFQAFSQQYVQIQEIFQVLDPNLQHELVMNDIVTRNAIGLAISIVAYIIVMVVFIVRAHHKYTGPLVAIQKFVQSMTNGHYSSRVRLRKGDEHMEELETALNRMAEELGKRHGGNHTVE